MSQTVFLDTDIGDNVDDTLALIYLLSRPDCRLEGISVLGTEAARRVEICRTVLHAFDRHIPVHSPDEGQPTGHLTRLAAKEPGTVNMVNLGPLTNTARALGDRPVLGSELAGMWTMAGRYYPGFAEKDRTEHNIVADPGAASTVFAVRLRRHTVVGLDVARHLSVPSDELLSRLKGAFDGELIDLLETQIGSLRQVSFNDPLLVALLFEPELCRYDRGRVTVTLEEGEHTGETVLQECVVGGPCCDVAISVNVAAFFDHFYEVVLRQAGSGTSDRE